MVARGGGTRAKITAQKIDRKKNNKTRAILKSSKTRKDKK